MKKYLLTVFGDFESKDCEEIAGCLEPIVDSTHLKFQYRSGVIIFHFASEFEISDVNDFLTLLSYDFYNSFILISKYLQTNNPNSKLNVCLPLTHCLTQVNETSIAFAKS